MSDSAGGGEDGGAAGAGQDSEADGEPPHPVPLDSGEVGGTSEEGIPPCAKRFRVGDEELGQEVEPEKAHEETPTEENPPSSAQSTVLLIKI